MKPKNFENKDSKIALDTLKCECGKKILLLPDIKAMDKAIKAHAKEHASQESDPEKAQKIFQHIQELLVKQALTLAAKSRKNKNS